MHRDMARHHQATGQGGPGTFSSPRIQFARPVCTRNMTGRVRFVPGEWCKNSFRRTEVVGATARPRARAALVTQTPCPIPYEVEHGSGLGAFLKRGGKPHFGLYPLSYWPDT